MEKIMEIGLSIAAVCNADCIYCPRSEFKKPKDELFMPLETVDKIVDEVTSPEFKEQHDFKSFVIGENGEACLHPDLIDILRKVRQPGLINVMFSNFGKFTKDIADTIIRERLVDIIHVNIDGLDDKTYHAVKRIPYDKTEDNLLYFLANRQGTPIYLVIHVITARNYAKAAEKQFGAWPHKLPMGTPLIPNEHDKIIAKWKPQLVPGDNIGADDCVLWAERGHVPRRTGDFSCPLLEKSKRSVLIAPNGDSYFCCFDCNNDIVVGNIHRETISQIHSGEKKWYVIKTLTEKFFPTAWPCNRVDCCQVVNFV